MEQTVHALGGILLRAIPTFLLVIFLYFYLKSMLFQPLEKVLAARDEATTGARKAAEALIQKADQKTAEYEAALREARSEMFRQQERMRRQWLDEQAVQVREAKAAGERMIEGAREQIAQEAAAARISLTQSSTELADQIASSILRGGGR
jgi:F-type H+-transporting ATPase subunit b